MSSGELEATNPKLAALQAIPPWQWEADAARAAIFEVLRDRQAEPVDRLVAADLCGVYVILNDEVPDVLLGLLEDNSEPTELRARAALSLGVTLEGLVEDVTLNTFGSSEAHAAYVRVVGAMEDLFLDESLPDLLRRSILEGSVRAPREWHIDAVQAAYQNGREDWRLTAVICMSYIEGFEKEILEALESENDLIFYHAVMAAGEWQMSEAWPYIAPILEAGTKDRDLLLAAIEAAPYVNPEEAMELVDPYSRVKDEEVATAAVEALETAVALLDEDEFPDEDDEDFMDDEEFDDEDFDDDEDSEVEDPNDPNLNRDAPF